MSTRALSVNRSVVARRLAATAVAGLLVLPAALAASAGAGAAGASEIGAAPHLSFSGATPFGAEHGSRDARLFATARRLAELSRTRFDAVPALAVGGARLGGARRPAPLTRLVQPHAVTTFTVESTADDPLSSSTATSCHATNGKCTLRAAVEAADNLGKAVLIKLGANNYVLTSGTSLDVADAGGITVEGSSESSTVISGATGNTTQLFFQNESSSGEAAGLFLETLTLEDAGDGAILDPYQPGTTSLTDVTVKDNTGGSGGAIATEGALWVTDSTLEGNEATEGGAIVCAECAMSLSDSTLSGNTAEAIGGAIVAEAASITIEGGSIDDNVAGVGTGGTGGALFAEEAEIVISGTHIDGNTAAKNSGEPSGGALAVEETSVELSGSQVEHNGAFGGFGSAILGVNAALTLDDDSLDSNGSSIGTVIELEESTGAPASTTLTGGTLSDNRSGGLITIADGGDSNSATVNGLTIEKNTIPDTVGCPPGVCVIDDEGLADLTMTKDTVEDESVTSSQQTAAAVLFASEAGSGTVDLSGDTFSDDATTGTGPDSAGAVGLFTEGTSGTYGPMDISVSGSTFEHDSTGAEGIGGALGIEEYNTGTSEPDNVVALSDDTFSYDSAGTTSSAGTGGAVAVTASATLSATGCTFSHDSAKGAGSVGGAMVLEIGGLGTLSGDTFTSDSAQEWGGGLVTAETLLDLADSTFAGDKAEGGGAAFVEETYGEVSGSTFSDDSVSGPSGETGGGGVLVEEAVVDFTNSTFSGDTAGNDGLGGAAYVSEGRVVFDSVTVTGNSASGGGGIEAYGEGQFLTFKDSIVSGNHTKASGGAESDCSYSHTSGDTALAAASGGGNVVGSSHCVDALAATDDVSAAPKLGTLAKNGGPTETIALESGSPALKRGISCLPTDQRGVARPATGCDSGAYELTKA